MDPTFGWPTRLTELLNEQYGEKWAYTGSFAMFCHAKKAGKECRQPGDIDVLIPSGGQPFKVGMIEGVQTHVNILCGKLKKAPFNGNGKSGSASAEIKDVFISPSGRAKVDIGQSSTEYGDVTKDVEEYEHAGIKHRIIKKNKLIGALTNRQKLVRTDKAAEDIAKLESL